MKFLILILLPVLFFCFRRTMRLGGLSAKFRRPDYLIDHRRSARLILFLMLTVVGLIEAAVRLGKPSELDELFYVHLACAVPTLLGLILLNTRLNGVKIPNYHGRVAIFTFIFFLFTLGTGIPLVIWRL